MQYWLISLFLWAFLPATRPLLLENGQVKLRWEQTVQGWKLQEAAVNRGGRWVSLPEPSAEYTLLYTSEKPKTSTDTVFTSITGVSFPEPIYHYQKEIWQEATNPVALNTAGKALHFLPSRGRSTKAGELEFRAETEAGILVSRWRFDPKFPNDVLVTQKLTVKKAGYYSLASPTLSSVPSRDLSWASVPGYFQGNTLQPNMPLAYAYGHGIPTLPVVYRERAASTLCPLLSTSAGLTLAVMPDPALCRDPWAKDGNTHQDWFIGLSHKNRKNEFSPTLYVPVLGEPNSLKKAGETIEYTLRYSLRDGDWYATIRHAIYEVFQLRESLALRQSRQSLSSRVQRMRHYLTNPTTSLWNVEEYQGLKIGAQSYLGGVVGSQRDAMKNSDYGAMWMLATTSGDTYLNQQVLPYALNFKFAQQISEPGFFNGALAGQYYLAKRKTFVEEWGEVVEPVAVTYYTMLDLGNILLFQPSREDLRQRLRAGADWLLRNQKPDGSWAVAYDRHSEEELYRDIRDLRSTFYGLLVAYRILGDEKYLAGARRGADWLLQHAVQTGSYLGVCGDARYAPDFATAQTAQAFLDLFDLTADQRYRQAAIDAARVYTTAIYTHPIPSQTQKMVNGRERADWEIAQAGLSFEHGGIFGSANKNGPIQLCSHAGLFVRMSQITGDSLFADLARAGALGRHAFVDSLTSVASYYWNAMNRGAGPYPHHAWWQIGWISDYLLAEAEWRSAGAVKFPRGFVTPKVGPHQTAGFAPGIIQGQPARLILDDHLVRVDHPAIDFLTARAENGGKLFVILLNNRAQTTTFQITIQGQKTETRQLPAFGYELLSI